MARKSYLLFAVILVVGLITPAAAEELVGSKALGMGGAFTAIADDTSSLYWNPAGLSRGGTVGGEISLGFHAGSGEELLDLAWSVLKGSFSGNGPLKGTVTTYLGANLKSYSGGLIRYDEINLTVENPYHYSEMTGNLAFAYRLHSKASLGVNIKIIQSQHTPYGADFQELTPLVGKGYAVDFGALVQPTQWLNLGVNMKNLGPDVVLSDGSVQMTRELEKSVTAGAAVKVPVVGTILAADYQHSFEGSAGEVHLGLEQKLLFGLLAVRGGVYGPVDNLQMERTLTLGMGLNLVGLHADLAVGTKDYFASDVSGVAALSINF